MPLTTKVPAGAADSFNMPQSDYIENVVLAAGVPQSIKVPADAAYAMFALTGSGDLYVKFNGGAAVPGVTTTDGSGMDINPTGRRLMVGNAPATTIGLASASACIVAVHFFLRA